MENGLEMKSLDELFETAYRRELLDGCRRVGDQMQFTVGTIEVEVRYQLASAFLEGLLQGYLNVLEQTLREF